MFRCLETWLARVIMPGVLAIWIIPSPVVFGQTPDSGESPGSGATSQETPREYTFNSFLDPAQAIQETTTATPGTEFTYQGYLRYADAPADGSYDFQFRLFEDSGGQQQRGTLREVLGVPVLSGTFTAGLDFGTVFDGAPLWLEIRVRPSGILTATYTALAPLQKLNPTPYAIHASGSEWSGLAGVPTGFSDNTDNDTLGDLSAAPGQVPKWDGNNWVAGDDLGGAAGWSLTGNSGTSPGTNFLGTSDNQPLVLAVNANRALRLEPNATSPNVIGGYGGNSAGGGVAGGTIGGGGRDLAINQVAANYGTVGGGAANVASGYAGVVDGGEGNTASQSYAAVGGGASNQAGGNYAVVGGGSGNAAGGSYAAIGGGASNVLTATYGTIGGGLNNSAVGSYGVIGGGLYNRANAAYSTVAGGGPTDLGNPTITNNRVADDYGTVGGGGGNVAGVSDGNATNQTFATVAGGSGNLASHQYASVGGGSTNSASGYGSVVDGGVTNQASNSYATVGGGQSNTAGGSNSVVSGGRSNAAGSAYASVVGGYVNSAGGAYSVVGGGVQNVITGTYGVIPGGRENHVGGAYGLAAGFRARAEHSGSFVWADSGIEAFGSTGPDQFLVKASGGVGIGTSTPEEMLSVEGSIRVQNDGAPIYRGVTPEYPHRPQEASAAYVAGKFLYLTGYATNVLNIYDISDPGHPAVLGYTTFQLGGPNSVQVSGQYAYVTSEGTDMLTVLDVSDPSDISHVADTGDLIPNPLSDPVAAYASGKIVYVASSGNDRLMVFGLADHPTTSGLTLLDFIDTNLDAPTDVYVAGSFAYVASRNNNRLAIFDVSDPRNVVARGFTSDQLDGPRAVHVTGNHAFVVCENSNALVSFDVANPEALATSGTAVSSLVRPVDVFVAGDYAYVAYAGAELSAEGSGLAVFDVSDPSNMVLKATTSEGILGATGVHGAGPILAVASEMNDRAVLFEMNHVDAPTAELGNLQAGHLDVIDNAVVNNDLSVRGGLHVGPSGALIEGSLSVEGLAESTILGNLGVGVPHSAYQLDVGEGGARFATSGPTSLLVRGAETMDTEGKANLDFMDNTFYDTEGEEIIPSAIARISFDRIQEGGASEIWFSTRDTFDAAARTTRMRISKEGNLLPVVDGNPDSYSLGDADHRWNTVYTINGVDQLSDRRMKTDIAPLPVGLREVLQLDAVQFAWKDHLAAGDHYGLVAQDVEPILPKVVRRGEDPDGPVAMNYTELVPVLIQAIQDQQAMIETQSARISALEQQVSEMTRERTASMKEANP